MYVMSARATEEGVVKFGDLRVGYSLAGEGRPLVLLHGFFGDSRVWRPQLEELSDEFAVVAWDAPGAGRSSDPPETFRMPEYAECLAGLIGFLGLERPCVVGLSFGATLALELFRRHPEVPRALVLAGAYAGWAGSLPPDVVEQRLSQTIPDLDLPADHVVAKYIPGLLTPAASRAVFNEVAAIMRDFHPAGMKAMTRSLAEANLREVLPRIGIPTLLLYGDRDVRSPLSVAEDLHATIPRSRLVVIPGAGHLSNAEAAERFNTEIRDFLGSVES
jgi:pimeloyl-ACP methyl ester carboxylesterase